MVVLLLPNFNLVLWYARYVHLWEHVKQHPKRTPMVLHTITRSRRIDPWKLAGLSAALLSFAVLSPKPVMADDTKIRHVLVISIDGMHALDMALWVKAHPDSALGKLAGQG